MTHLKEVYGTDFSKMVFDKLDSYNPKWKNIYSVSDLNLMYMSHSGNKLISPLIEMVLGTDTTLSDSAKTQIASIINIKFMKNWNYLWDGLYATYDPIENYNMEESEDTSDKKVESTVIDKTETRNLAGTTDITTTNNNSVYGYDSSTATPDSSSTEVVDNGTTDTGTIDTDDTTRYSTNNTLERTLERHGNIGVTTAQQMIESEIELRKKDYFSMIMRDIDTILTLGIYE